MSNTKVYFDQGGSTLNVDSGGAIAIDAASGLTIGGVANTGVVKGGTVTLDGSNPTTVATGLTTITAATLTTNGSDAPGDDPVNFTWTASGGTLSIYAWKHNGTDPTLVASTNNAAVVSWIAVGS